MARVFGYGRASTDKQQITLKAQEEVCSSYFHLRHLQDASLEYAGWYPDAAITAKIPWLQRPMGQRIFLELHPGDIVVTSNLDRIFRSVIDCATSLNTVEEKQFALVILDVNVDTSTPLGRTFVQVMAAFKELERMEISRRTKEALHYNRRHMKAQLRNAPVGWMCGTGADEGEYVPCKEDRYWAREIVDMRHRRGMAFMHIVQNFEARKIKPKSRCHCFNLRRVARSYVAALCGFPKVYICDLPLTADLRAYVALHGGQPPRLEPDAVSQGLLHTLPPNLDLPPIVFPQMNHEYRQRSRLMPQVPPNVPRDAEGLQLSNS